MQPPDCRETGGGAGGLCRDEALHRRAVAAPTPAGADGGRAGARPRKGGDGGSSHDVGAGFGGGDAEVAQRRVREPYRQPCRLAAGESGGVGETHSEGNVRAVRRAGFYGLGVQRSRAVGRVERFRRFGEQADCRHEHGVQPADGAAEERRRGIRTDSLTLQIRKASVLLRTGAFCGCNLKTFCHAGFVIKSGEGRSGNRRSLRNIFFC